MDLSRRQQGGERSGASGRRLARSAGQPQGRQRHALDGVPQRRHAVAASRREDGAGKRRTIRHPSALAEGDVPHWLVASGVRGVKKLTLPLAPAGTEKRTYTVRLYFIEPDRQAAGQRQFDVAVQGKTLLRGLDVSREAGGPNRGLVKEFMGVKVGKELTIDLRLLIGSAVKESVLSGVEMVAEGWYAPFAANQVSHAHSSPERVLDAVGVGRHRARLQRARVSLRARTLGRRAVSRDTVPSRPSQCCRASADRLPGTGVSVSRQVSERRSCHPSRSSAARESPWLVVHYPASATTTAPIWQGPLTDDAVAGLLQSPCRRDLVRRLLAGDSAVWMLLEGGDRKTDDDVASQVTAISRRLEAA